MSDPGGIHPSFVPADQDFQIFIPPTSIDEGAGSLFSLVSGITFHGNSLKNPFFFHFIFTAELTEIFYKNPC
jgi:hypothetical protein